MKTQIFKIFAASFVLFMWQSHLYAQAPLNEETKKKVKLLMHQGQLDKGKRYEALVSTKTLLSQIPKNKDAGKVATVLDLLADHQAIKDKPLDRAIMSADLTNNAENRLKVDKALLLRIAHLLKIYSPQKIGPTEAKILMQIANYIEQVEKTISTLPEKEKTLLRKATNGVLKDLARIATSAKVEEKTAREFVTAIRAMTVARGLLPHGNPISPYFVPGLITGEILGQTRKALNHASETLSYFPQVLKGDKKALEKMLKSAEGMKDALGKEKYGNSILNTLPNKILEEFDLFKYLGAWFGVPDLKHFQSKKDGKLWHSSWGEFRIGAGSIEPVKGSFMDRNDITLQLSYTSQGAMVGSYEIGSIKETGTMVLKISPGGRLPDGTVISMSGRRYPDQKGKRSVKFNAYRTR